MDLRSLFLLVILGSSAFPPCSVSAQSPTAPTNAQAAEIIAETWQRASAKYDAPRNAILAEGSLKYSLQPDGLHIEVPAKPAEDYGFAFGIGLDGAAQ